MKLRIVSGPKGHTIVCDEIARIVLMCGPEIDVQDLEYICDCVNDEEKERRNDEEQSRQATHTTSEVPR